MKMTVSRPKGPKPDFARPVHKAARAAKSQAWEERSGMEDQIKMKIRIKIETDNEVKGSR